MKHKFLLLAAMFFAATSLFAQSADNEDEVIKIDRWNQQAFREGEILVKFKADGAVQMRAPQRRAFSSTQVNTVDALFQQLGVDSVEQLMPRTGHINVGRKLRAYNGSEIEVKDLSKLYRLTLKPEKAQNIHEAIEQLKASSEVEFAEPNYIVYTMALPYDTVIPTADMQAYTSEPLYSQQWGIPAIYLPQLWNMPKKSSKRPVIAILDTGVDIEHPDLAANIWTNTAEANGIANQDDDANGFKDDIHGWSFIDNHSVTGDFNGHGTHCAGIAAAVGNNGIGITGANPDALIMPVTVMQSNGTGDVATIVKGIDYASANGADVISMSIGGYGYSIAEEQALGRAYANAVLVAAAGNDSHAMAGAHCILDAPMFPAAFTFVLGVEASANAQGGLAGFSNYDETGPIYSSFNEGQLYNYELRAPGVQIMSTFPGGRYKILNGTSMACPLAAGAISRLIQCKETLSWELLFGDLIHMRNGNIDMLATYNITDADRHPELALVTANLTDTASGDGDMRADAGETIEFYPIFKNAWGQADNIRYWMNTGYYNQGDWVWDDTTLVQHLQDTAYFGKPLSSYAKATALNPYRLHISPDCADGRRINMTFLAICENAADTLRQTISIEVENGVEIGGMISENLTLYPNVHYIVTRPLAVPAGVTLTIQPGTILKFKDNTGISVSSTPRSTTKAIIDGVEKNITYCDPSVSGGIVAKGTPDSMIVFKKADGASGKYTLKFGLNYPTISGSSLFLDTMPQYDSLARLICHPLEYIKIEGIMQGEISENLIDAAYCRNCEVKNCRTHAVLKTALNGAFVQSNIYNTIDYYHHQLAGHVGLWNNYADNLSGSLRAYNSSYHNNNVYPEPMSGAYGSTNYTNYYIYYSSDATPIIKNTPNLYYGTSKESIARKYIYDIERGYNFGYYDISNMLTRPVREAHGIVWKILVDDIDAQDEFELLPPIGVGMHKCDVYFNRPMDVSIAPTISFGVRAPYTQHQVAYNGSWSADSTIYTAYFTIDAKSVTDGLNRFKVYGAEDNEHFEIPEENLRFHMEVSAAGSMSTGLMAEAGLGKVTLIWETDEEDFADLLGYNIYRWTQDTIRWDRYYDNTLEKWIEAGWRFDTICINTTLIDAADTSYVDFNVIPGKDYYYVIRQVTTSLNSYDLSNPVVARPLTAIKGDANGSMSVDVADVITEVNYITRQNPQPFIFEAADVNSDNDVNIIDVVATIDLILHPETQTNAINEDPAYYYIENGILYVESDIVLGGVQCTFTAEQGHTFTTLDALNGFETVGTWQAEDQYLFLAFSMSGRTLGVGKHALLQVGDAELSDIVLSDAQGHNINALPQLSTALDGTSVFLPCSGKFIKDGNLYIKIGNRIYSATGTLIE